MIDVKEAARRLGVHHTRVKQFIKDGRLPAQLHTERLQTFYLLEERDVEEFSKQKRRPGAPPRKQAEDV